MASVTAEEQELINILVAQGKTEAEIQAIIEALPPAEEASPLPPTDINPLHAIGAAARRVGNVLNVLPSAAQSLLYTGGFEGTADSKAVKNFLSQMGAIENPFAQEGLLEGVKTLGAGIERAGKALDVAPPMAREFLKTPAIPGRNFLGQAGEQIKNVYSAAKNQPAVQRGMEITSDIALDPLSYVSGGANPNTRVANLVERGGQAIHSTPFKLLGIDKSMGYTGYNPLSKLAYEKNIGGTLGQMTSGMDKYVKKATEETKKMVDDLSKAGATVDLNDVRTLALENARKVYAEAGLPEPENINSVLDQIMYWTRDVGQEAEVAKILRETAEEGKKMSALKDVSDLTPEDIATNNRLFEKFINATDKQLPLKEANRRKALLNARMKATEFNPIAGGRDSAEYAAQADVRNLLQRKEIEAAKKANPEIGAILEAENKNLSTGIEGYRRLAKKDSREMSMMNTLLENILYPVVTQPPLLYKRARQSPFGGAFDVGTRKGLFNILENLDTYKEKEK